MQKEDVIATVVILGILILAGLWHSSKVDTIVATCVPNHALKICEYNQAQTWLAE